MLLWMEGEGWMGDEILDVSRDWTGLGNGEIEFEESKEGFEDV